TQLPACSWNQSYLRSVPFAVGEENYPVTYVNWCDAYAYCAWAGKRLCGRIGAGSVDPQNGRAPPSDQWARACANGGASAYPYGATYEPLRCNGPKAAKGGTVPVGSLPGCVGNDTRLHDMSGNVWEWIDACSDQKGQDDECYTRGGAYT